MIRMKDNEANQIDLNKGIEKAIKRALNEQAGESQSNIEKTRSSFFPNSKTAKSNAKASQAISTTLTRNDAMKAKQIGEKTSLDANVSINDAIKDFSRIKKL